MASLFGDYKIVVLDSVFFENIFSQDLKDGLAKAKVYVSNTFQNELEEYKLILPEKQKKIFNLNIYYIRRNVVLNTMNFSSTQGIGDRLNEDIWGLINLLAEVNKKAHAKIVVVTSHQLLIQKIVLYGMDLDIYDLDKQVFICKDSFLQLHDSYALEELKESNVQKDIRVSKGSTVYLSRNKKIILADEVSITGGEAKIYKIANKKSYIAKIFKKSKLDEGKIKNIRNISKMNAGLNLFWAVFPEGMIYADSDCQIPIGLIERYVPAGMLQDVSLYSGNLLDISGEDLNKKISYSVDICLKVVRQICYLSKYGFCVLDYNMNNFGISNCCAILKL